MLSARHRPARRALSSLAVAALMGPGAAACGLILGDDDAPCEPVAALTLDDIREPNGPTLDQSFCEVTTPYSRHIYATSTSLGGLIDRVRTYVTDWTVPADAESIESPGAVEVRFGVQSGEVCVSHENACTERNGPVCRTVTVLTENVWSAVADLPVSTNGALAQDDDAVYWVNPLNPLGYGVWRLDKATLTWSQVADSMPEGNPAAFEFQGGAAIVVDDVLHYLADDALFLFDTTTNTWQRAGTATFRTPSTRTPLVHDARLWVYTPEVFYVYDPATRSQRQIGETINFADGVAFVVEGKLAFGAGRDLFAAVDQPASWQKQFSLWDPLTETQSDYPLDLPDLHFTQAMDLGDTTILLTNDGPNFVVDEATGSVRELLKNPALGCAGPVDEERHGAWQGAALSFDGVGLAVGGRYATGTGVDQMRGAMLYFP
jgi:hypothetical protein